MVKDNKIAVFKSEDGKISVDVNVEQDTIWMTQAQIAKLYMTDRSVIAKHLKNIFDSGELSKQATCAKNAQVQKEGSRNVYRDVDHYNLDAIISVGYRVNSVKATQFRIWATKQIREKIMDSLTGKADKTGFNTPQAERKKFNFVHLKAGKEFFEEKSLSDRLYEAGISQRDLSKMTGISEVTISNYNTGRIPCPENVQKIKIALNIPLVEENSLAREEMLAQLLEKALQIIQQLTIK